MQRPDVNQSKNILTGQLEINCRGLQMLLSRVDRYEIGVFGKGNEKVCGLYLIFI